MLGGYGLGGEYGVHRKRVGGFVSGRITIWVCGLLKRMVGGDGRGGEGVSRKG